MRKGTIFLANHNDDGLRDRMRLMRKGTILLANHNIFKVMCNIAMLSEYAQR